MHIPKINYYNNSYYVSGNHYQTPSPVFSGIQSKIMRTSSPEIPNYLSLLSKKYQVNDHIKFFIDGLNQISTINRKLLHPLKVADIGCSDGELSRTLSVYLPKNTVFFGIDLSDEMLDIAKKKDLDLGINSYYANANAFDLPYKENSMDAMILSSTMHELYSYANPKYGEKAYSKNSILHFLQSAYKVLTPGGVLIIKDPATPDKNLNEKLVISNINKNDGKIPFIAKQNQLKKADITKICTYNKLQRFCMEFLPAQGKVRWDKEGNCIMPKWLVTEFLRQRKFVKSPENWSYEIKEQYGTMTPKEIESFARGCGFEVIKSENISIKDSVNRYAFQEDEFVIKDSDNVKKTAEDFPMFLQVVLRKPVE